MIKKRSGVGVPLGIVIIVTCIPSKAKMKMKRKRRRRRDMMDDKAFIRAITRFRSGDQYLQHLNPSYGESSYFYQLHKEGVTNGLNIVRSSMLVNIITI